MSLHQFVDDAADPAVSMVVFWKFCQIDECISTRGFRVSFHGVGPPASEALGDADNRQTIVIVLTPKPAD